MGTHTHAHVRRVHHPTAVSTLYVPCPSLTQFFLLIRVLNVDPSQNICWQEALVDREIDIILHNRYRARVRGGPTEPAPDPTPGPGAPQRALDGDDTCCICQEMMTAFDELEYCSTCGNNIHGHCLDVWHRHGGSDRRCPLCRANWVGGAKRHKPQAAIPTIHPGVTCSCCGGMVDGPLYRCQQCRNLHLCVGCFVMGTSMPSKHTARHTFKVKQRPYSNWATVVPMKTDAAAPIAPDAARALAGRDITSDDYDLLLTLDDNVAKPGIHKLHPSWLKSHAFPVKSVTDMKLVGQSTCGVCLAEFAIGDFRRMLPCQHIFHAACVDRWLVKEQDLCPTCKEPVLADRLRGTPYRVVDKTKARAKANEDSENGPAQGSARVQLAALVGTAMFPGDKPTQGRPETSPQGPPAVPVPAKPRMARVRRSAPLHAVASRPASVDLTIVSGAGQGLVGGVGGSGGSRHRRHQSDGPGRPQAGSTGEVHRRRVRQLNLSTAFSVGDGPARTERAPTGRGVLYRGSTVRARPAKT